MYVSCITEIILSYHFCSGSPYSPGTPHGPVWALLTEASLKGGGRVPNANCPPSQHCMSLTVLVPDLPQPNTLSHCSW